MHVLCCFGKSTHIVWRAAAFFGASHFMVHRTMRRTNDTFAVEYARTPHTVRVGISFAACRQPGEKIEFPEILHINKMALCAYVCRLIWLAIRHVRLYLYQINFIFRIFARSPFFAATLSRTPDGLPLPSKPCCQHPSTRKPSCAA